MKTAGEPPADRRLIRYVALGFLASLGFVVFDIYSESLIGAGTISGRHAGVHFVVDHLLPEETEKKTFRLELPKARPA
jgi:hypothetical protein